MNIKAILKLVAALLLVHLSAAANAEGLGAYAGFGVGTPRVVLGSSDLGFKIFGGAKIQDFSISDGGKIDLAIQGEYVNFGKTTYLNTSRTGYALAIDAVANWVIPRKWVSWTDEKLAVIVKLGGAHVAESGNSLTSSSTTSGLSKGLGVEYRFMPELGVSVMHEQYPAGYELLNIAGVFHF